MEGEFGPHPTRLRLDAAVSFVCRKEFRFSATSSIACSNRLVALLFICFRTAAKAPFLLPSIVKALAFVLCPSDSAKN